MKMNFLKFGFYTIIFAMTLFVTACGGGEATTDSGEEEATEQHEEGHDDQEHSDEEHSEVDMDSKEYASAYVCPMHCEGSGSDAEGKCPVCGMDYVANDKHKESSHEH